MRDAGFGSDLAGELMNRLEREPAGITRKRRTAGDVTVDEIRVITPEAAKLLGKPVGRYLTLECGSLHRMSEAGERSLISVIAGELKGTAERLTGKKADGSFSVLAVGLGNAELTADAVGPESIRRLNATRHLAEAEEKLYRKLGCCSLSAFAPGVLGQTGIETAELVRAAVRTVSPDVVVTVDALAARSLSRLASTVQISDAGIEPGSGVGNHRNPLTEETLGVPVIAIGVPTVVHSFVMVRDALEAGGIQEQTEEKMEEIVRERADFFVSLKETDEVKNRVAALISRAIHDAFTPKVPLV